MDGQKCPPGARRRLRLDSRPAISTEVPMSTSHSSGEFISEFGGAIRGGTTIVLSDPKDIDSIYSLVRYAGPMFRTMYRTVTASPGDLVNWLASQRTNRNVLPLEGEIS